MEANCSAEGGGDGGEEESDSNNCYTLTTATTAELPSISIPVEHKGVMVEETGGGRGASEETVERRASEETGERGASEETGERGNSEEILCVCAICCCTVEKVPLTEEDDIVFLWFLKWFRFEPLSSIRRGLYDKRNGGWKDTVGESLRFCEPCKVEVMEIKAIPKKFKSTRRIKAEKKIAMNKVRVRMRECEGIFEKKKIYEKDNRYYLLRIKAFKVPTVFVGNNGYWPRKKKEEVCSEMKTEEVDGDKEKVDEVEEEDTPKMRISRRLKKPVTYYVPEVTGKKRKGQIENQVDGEGKNKEVDVNKEESEVQVKLEEFPVEYEGEEMMGGMDNFWFGEDCEIDKKEELVSVKVLTETESQPTKRAKKDVKKKTSKGNRRPGPLSKVGARAEVKKVAPSIRPIRRNGGKSLRSHLTRNRKRPAKTLNEIGAGHYTYPDNGHHQRNCLFCYKAISPEDIKLKQVLTSDLVEANFTTFFILRKMLNISKSKITDYLSSFGNPQNWIQFCRRCLSVVDEALIIQKRIEELEIKLRKLQNGMLDKINTTFKSGHHSHQKKRRRISGCGSISRISEETRQFIYSKSTIPPSAVNQAIPQKAPTPVTFVEPAPPQPQPPLPAPCKLPRAVIPEETFVAILEEEPFETADANSDHGHYDNIDLNDFIEDEPPLSQLSLRLPSPRKLKGGLENNPLDFSEDSCDAIEEEDPADDPDYNFNEDVSPLSPSSPPPLSPSLLSSSLSRRQRKARAALRRKVTGTGNVRMRKRKAKVVSSSSSDPQDPLDQGMYKCLLCPTLRPMTLGKFYSHGIFHFKRQFKCLECDLYWSGSSEELEKNPFKTQMTTISEETGGKRSRHFCSMESLQKMDKFKVGDVWRCEWCRKSFCLDTERDSHEQECPGRDNKDVDLKLKCLSCPEEDKKGYRSYEEWLLHRISEHPRICLTSCLYCDESFVKTGQDGGIDVIDFPAMNNHVLEQHPLTSKFTGCLPTCYFCGAVFGRRMALRQHVMLSHAVNKVKTGRERETAKVKETGKNYDDLLEGGEYKCSLCPSQGTPMSLIQFYSHVMFHYRRPFKCSECNLYWSGTNELQKNPFTAKSGKDKGHVCSMETLKEMPGLQPGNIWKCTGCPEAFSKEIERDSHEQEKCPNKTEISFEGKYKCLSCSDDKKGYRSYEEWLLHRVLEHTEKAITSCLFCDESSVIKTKDGLDYFDTAAIRLHVFGEHPSSRFKGVYPSTCDFCGVTCQTHPELGRHVEKIHGLKESDAFSCRSCHFRALSTSMLKKHVLRRHALVVPASMPCAKKKCEFCDFCGMKMYTPGPFALANHKLLKHGIEPPEDEEYQRRIKRCEVEGCGFRCLDYTVFKKHGMKEHGAERPHKCEECGKGFFDSGKLTEHLKIHRNKETKPYQCEICGNSFALRNYLYIHMRLTHLNRPFASTHKKKPYRRRSAGRGVDRGAGGGSDAPAIPQTPHHLLQQPTPIPQFPSQSAPVVPCFSTGDMDMNQQTTNFSIL